MFRKIKIKQLPNMAYGGKVFNQVAPNALPDHVDEAPLKVKDTLKPVAREGANIEAEKGETAFYVDVDGLPAHYKIGGKRHSQGGTPLNVPDDTFIFSDTRAMLIKDKDLLAQFSESKSKTPAEIAAKYDINKYRQVLSNKSADDIQKSTAERMIKNNTLILGKLALIQESMKGFPQGIPLIAQPYMVVNNIEPGDILPKTEGASARFQDEAEAPAEMQQEAPMGKYGFNFSHGGHSLKMRRIRITGIPQMADGGPAGSGQGVLKDLIEFNPRFYQDILGLIKSGTVTGEFPQVQWSEGERDRYAEQFSVQNSANVYGREDWSTGAYFEDFKKRHKWFFDQNPEFDPHKRSDVKKFQRAYCNKMQEFGTKSCWFIDNGGSGTAFDGKFGQHTWSAPSLNPKPKEEPKTITEVVDDEKDTVQSDIPVVPLVTPPNQGAAFEYFPQDVLNLYTGLSQQIPRMKTWYPPLQFRGVEPELLTPNLHPIQSVAAATQQASQAYAPRQKATALSSQMQGKAAEQAANEFYRVAQTNAGILTDANYKNAQIANQNMMYNAQNEMEDFDTRQKYAADRLMARNAKRANNALLYNTMLDNAVKAKNISDLYPQYDIDPSTGGLITFTQGMPLIPNQQSTMSPRTKEYMYLRSKGYEHDEAIDIIGRQSSKGQYSDDSYNFNNPYDYQVGPYPGLI